MSGGNDEKVDALYQSLKTELLKERRDKQKCLTLISQLKLVLLELDVLPPVPASSSDTAGSAREKKLFVTGRDFLEMCCQLSIDEEDVASFHKYFTQLKTFYLLEQTHGTGIPESAFKYELIGCHLLCLLSEKKLAEFHCELELLVSNQEKKHVENVYIRQAVQVEQCLMEGAYHKILLSSHNLPSARFGLFMGVLCGSIRDEIGNCLQISAKHPQLSTQHASQLLLLPSQNSQDLLASFAQQREWRLDSGGPNAMLHMNNNSEDSTSANGTGDQSKTSNKMMDMTNYFINYAVQLETII